MCNVRRHCSCHVDSKLCDCNRKDTVSSEFQVYCNSAVPLRSVLLFYRQMFFCGFFEICFSSASRCSALSIAYFSAMVASATRDHDKREAINKAMGNVCILQVSAASHIRAVSSNGHVLRVVGCGLFTFDYRGCHTRRSCNSKTRVSQAHDGLFPCAVSGPSTIDRTFLRIADGLLVANMLHIPLALLRWLPAF